jgi:pyrimidine precursor biosynthesis enzyme
MRNGSITSDVSSIKGKRIGYVGQFGKVIVDELMQHYGMTADDYQAIRVGMNVTDAIKRGVIDGGVGLENVQMVELEHWCKDKTNVAMLRIDELAELGCCCFCSILYIANDEFIANNPEKVKAFMKAIKRATEFILTNPSKAYELYVEIKPQLNTEVNKNIYDRSLTYISKDLRMSNVTGTKLQTIVNDWA